jgi:hypothetical protein
MHVSNALPSKSMQASKPVKNQPNQGIGIAPIGVVSDLDQLWKLLWKSGFGRMGVLQF